ncbi:hypothetical protein B0H63DRAFT_265990 [Podospora didyma]|uniref:Heavy metal tolerance protein n=1 Tax=Podospora didyma TaxID=330526 RepID=A0AAE0KFU6_9PEZI|nr:hypothetical protein B0H63DRAFT_265990 [Podospora didyma]
MDAPMMHPNGGDWNATADPSTAAHVFRTAQLCYSVVLLLAFIVSAGVHSIITSRSEEELVVPTALGPGGKPLPVTKRKREHEEPRVRDVYSGTAVRRTCQYVTVGIILSFFANGTAIALHALQSHNVSDEAWGWWCGEERTVYVAGSAFLYVYVLITLFDWDDSPNIVHFVIWSLGLVGETVILLAFAFIVSGSTYNVHGAHDFKAQMIGQKPAAGIDPWALVDLTIGAIRLCFVVLLVCLYTGVAVKGYLAERRLLDEESHRSDTDESSPLLNGNGANYHTQSNGEQLPNSVSEPGYQQRDEDAAFYRPDKLPHKSWFEYCRGYSIFFPYLWPSNSQKLKGIVLLCFILVVLQRGVNILVPLQSALVTDLLNGKPREPGEPERSMWVQLGFLILFKMLQGPSGLLGSLRSILWIPVSQHTYRALTTAAFEHVHSLSLDFHLGKRTGEVLSALNKGASINQFLEQVTFQVLPMLVDLGVAIVFFAIAFGPKYALFVSVITFYYLYLTIRMAATRADQRRDMVNADREEEAVKNDSITSYETVKYFNAEKFEFDRYRNAIMTFQVAEAKVTWGINHMNMCQSMVFMCGMLVAMMTCAFEVSQGRRSVGDFILLITYLQQLQGPLNFFGTFYRTVQQAMISGERLLELFKIQPTVVDKLDAEPLPHCTGHIKWNKVGFTYDRRRQALHDLSFECKPGTTTAFVGESGGGKSTVFRLMFRYYNCQEGSIQVDGRDVKDLTIDSVRRFIGVVPQDTILFNETLMYNLKYANPSATDEDIFEACRAAAIHDRILSFPDGYLTKVGERGLRLSGGEKQRVAIARTILKKPKVIMLDEATSALDGETEQKIQAKLISGNFGQDRTLLIIAHRLSTITHADQIIVLHAGTVAEKGTHEELLALKGRYSSMWEKHCRAERAAEEARDATQKAKKLMYQANLSGVDEASDGFNSMVSSTILQTGIGSPTASSSHHISDAPARDNMSISSHDSNNSANGSEGTLRGDDSGDHEDIPNAYTTGDTAVQPFTRGEDSPRLPISPFSSTSRLVSDDPRTPLLSSSPQANPVYGSNT